MNIRATVAKLKTWASKNKELTFGLLAVVGVSLVAISAAVGVFVFRSIQERSDGKTGQGAANGQEIIVRDFAYIEIGECKLEVLDVPYRIEVTDESLIDEVTLRYKLSEESCDDFVDQSADLYFVLSYKGGELTRFPASVSEEDETLSLSVSDVQYSGEGDLLLDHKESTYAINLGSFSFELAGKPLVIDVSSGGGMGAGGQDGDWDGGDDDDEGDGNGGGDDDSDDGDGINIVDLNINNVYPIDRSGYEATEKAFSEGSVANIDESIFILYLDAEPICEGGDVCENWAEQSIWVYFYVRYGDGTEKDLYGAPLGDLGEDYNFLTLYRGYNIAATIFPEDQDYEEAEMRVRVSDTSVDKKILDLRQKNNNPFETSEPGYVSVFVFDNVGEYGPISDTEIRLLGMNGKTIDTGKTNKYGHVVLNYTGVSNVDVMEVEYTFPRNADYDQTYIDTYPVYADRSGSNKVRLDPDGFGTDEIYVGISERCYSYPDIQYYVGMEGLYRVGYFVDGMTPKTLPGGKVKFTSDEESTEAIVELYSKASSKGLREFVEGEVGDITSYSNSTIFESNSHLSGKVVSVRYLKDGKYHSRIFSQDVTKTKVVELHITLDQSEWETNNWPDHFTVLHNFFDVR